MNENKLDPLAEVGLPNICNLLNWNHHSATQTTYPDGPFAFRYLICDQKTRRMFEGNANMAAGVAVNNAIQYFKCKTIFNNNVPECFLHRSRRGTIYKYVLTIWFWSCIVSFSCMLENTF